MIICIIWWFGCENKSEKLKSGIIIHIKSKTWYASMAQGRPSVNDNEFKNIVDKEQAKKNICACVEWMSRLRAWDIIPDRYVLILALEDKVKAQGRELICFANAKYDSEICHE